MRCYRIRFSDLAICEVEEKSCRKSRVKFSEALTVARLFRKCGNLGLIRDGKFLMGEISTGKTTDDSAGNAKDDSSEPSGEPCDGKVGGKRIDVLPDGAKLSGAFPLFASRLAVHDERSHGHWDVIFENPNGSLSYVYSLDKVRISEKEKFGLVDDFEKCLPRLRRNLRRELARSQVAGRPQSGMTPQGMQRMTLVSPLVSPRSQEGNLVLAMLILLKTRMRVGSEVYYKRSRHKGLTTLKKKDLKIVGDKITFDFVGKDGVPQRLEERFSKKVLLELKRVLRKRKADDFVFLDSNGKVFRDVAFEAAFERFCGERFYPHIVRSHFATREVEAFLRKEAGGRRQAAGGARKFCLGLASKLGHKKFVKGEWKDSFEVTLHYYVRPDLVERIKKLI